MAESRFEPGPILAVLLRHGVRFIVVGGIAGRLHGSPRLTRDLDVCYARQPDDLARIAGALEELRVTLRGAPKGLPFRPDERTLRNGLNFTFDTEWGPFDCLGDASGYTFEVLAPNAERAVLDGIEIPVASLDDLIRMKRAAGRPQDIADVETLGKLRDVRESRGLFGLAEPVPGPSRRTPRGSARSRAHKRS